MLDVGRDIQSLSDFKRRTRSFLTDLRQKGRMLVLTINGRAELVVMNPATFQAMRDELEALRAQRAEHLEPEPPRTKQRT